MRDDKLQLSVVHNKYSTHIITYCHDLEGVTIDGV
jgi:hypothetical protein